MPNKVVDKYGPPAPQPSENVADRLTEETRKQAHEQGQAIAKNVEMADASKDEPGRLASPTTPGHMGTDGKWERTNPVAEKYAAPSRDDAAEKTAERERNEPERD
ncbi:MAG: hypothetical protein JSU89_11040 [Myxococcales bacterium]|nr:MAG: hypothetical protein JSU89_11040 [Myxococcales bacterium]